MNPMQLKNAPIATTGMLIRRPVGEVFNAFIDPVIVTNFWFTRSSGRLEAGKQVTWTWEMYNISTPVRVKEIENNKRILSEWGDPGKTTTVEWIFTPYEKDATFVSITNSGFSGDGDQVVEQALGSTGGFSWVLAGAKVWLERGSRLNLVADRFPKGIEHP